jgi:glucoamylase
LVVQKRAAAVGTEGEKALIGTAIGEASRVWFTLARGRLTEVFYPTPDRACLRALGFVVAGDGFVSEEEADTLHSYTQPHDDVPMITVVNRDRAGRYQLEKETIADPRSSVVLQRVRWRAQPQVRLYCSLEAPRDHGADHHATVLEHRGMQLLTAHRAGLAVALACTRPWLRCSAGVVGESDGRTELRAHQTLTTCHATAHGQVSLIGELAVSADDSFVLALAFAHTSHEAAHLALAALVRGYAPIRAQFVQEWQAWSAPLAPRSGCGLWSRSLTVLKTLEAKRVDGGRVAALSTPWGPSRGSAGTYHLAWTRDLVESIGGMLAAGVHDEARAALVFLYATQHPDGHWPQNMRLDGERVWRHEELDEAALPILLVDLLQRERALPDRDLELAWSMVVRAADHLVRTGPATTLDRWEDASGVTPFTIAAEIAALVYAAALADQRGHARAAHRYRTTAARWNAELEPLLYRRGGALAELVGVDGYYVRARIPGQAFPTLDVRRLPRTEVSPDALALVRFGLRDADDPRIRNTVRVIDRVLATQLPDGPAWRRYPGDAYGEHADGEPFDRHGIGRPWPLLIGERAHYELARGDRAHAIRLLHAMEACANATGMLPEQVWDGPDLPERGLYHGGPTGSAAPLGWTHAEYVKLCRSLADDRVFDLPSVRV